MKKLLAAAIIAALALAAAPAFADSWSFSATNNYTINGSGTENSGWTLVDTGTINLADISGNQCRYTINGSGAISTDHGIYHYTTNKSDTTEWSTKDDYVISLDTTIDEDNSKGHLVISLDKAGLTGEAALVWSNDTYKGDVKGSYFSDSYDDDDDGGSGGCSAGFGLLALLAVLPVLGRRKS